MLLNKEYHTPTTADNFQAPYYRVTRLLIPPVSPKIRESGDILNRVEYFVLNLGGETQFTNLTV